MAARGSVIARCAWIGSLWIGIGFTIGVLLAAVAPLAVGDQPLIVRSASMAPAVDAGDVIVTRPIEPLAARIGDIVTFRDPDGSGRLINHRVRALHRAGNRVEFTTQGDANTAQEHWTVPVGGRIGRDVYRLPMLGYPLVWIQTPAGRIGLIVIPALLLGAFTLARIWRPQPGGAGGDA